MASNKKNSNGYIVSFRIDPQKSPDKRGYVNVDIEEGQFYCGPLDNPDEWEEHGYCAIGEKRLPKNKPLRVDLSLPDDKTELAWVVSYAPHPAASYKDRNLSPFKQTTLRNEDGEPAKAGPKDREGRFHYTLTTQTMENSGRFLFAIYATVVTAGNEGTTFAIDPEMEVSEI